MMHLHFFLLLLIGEAWSATLKDAGAQNYVQDLDDDSKNRQSDTILVIIESFRTIHERLDMLEKRMENEIHRFDNTIERQMNGLHRQLKDSDRKIEKVHHNVERNTKLIQTLSDTCSKEHITTAKPSTASPSTTPKDTWSLIAKNICYGAKDDTPGNFRVQKNMTLLEIKLVHNSGHVSCRASDASCSSNWGCGCDNYARSDTVITDLSKREMFPNHGTFPKGFTAETSPSLMYTPTEAILTGDGLDLQIWYSEDLYDFTETNNGGVHCVSVFAKSKNFG